MIIEQDKRKVELRMLEDSSKTSVDFYSDDRLLMSLIVEEDYSQLEQSVLLSRAYIQIATQFLYEGFRKNVFEDINYKFISDDAYWDKIAEKNFLLVASKEVYIKVPLSDGCVASITIGCFLVDFFMEVEKTIGDNVFRLTYYEEFDMLPFTRVSESSFYDLLLDDSFSIQVNRDKIKCYSANFDNEYYGVIHDYDIDFVIPYAMFDKFRDSDYLESVDFLEKGHLFTLTQKQIAECTERRLACKDDSFHIIIKSIHFGGTIKF